MIHPALTRVRAFSRALSLAPSANGLNGHAGIINIPVQWDSGASLNSAGAY